MPSRSRRSASAAAPASEPTSAPTQAEAGPGNAALQEQLASEQTYSDALGGWLGGKLHGAVSDNLAPDKIDGYARDGIASGTDALADWALDHAPEDQKGQASEGLGHLTSQLNGSLGGAFASSSISEGISDFALSHPRTMLGAAGLGAAAYVLSDQPLDDLDTKIKLGGGNDLLLGGDFGSTMDPSIDALRAGYRYQDGGQSFRANAETRFDKDAWSLDAAYDRRLANGGLLSLSGAHRQEDDRNLTTAGINYRDEEIAAHLKGSYDSNDGGVGAVSGGFHTLDEDGPTWTGGFDANTRGAWNANLGVSHTDEERNLEWFAKGFAGQDAAGDTDYGVRAGLTWKF